MESLFGSGSLFFFPCTFLAFSSTPSSESIFFLFPCFPAKLNLNLPLVYSKSASSWSPNSCFVKKKEKIHVRQSSRTTGELAQLAYRYLMMLVPRVITLLLVTVLHRSRIFVTYIVVFSRVQYILHDRMHLILLDPALASMSIRLPFPRVVMSVR